MPGQTFKSNPKQNKIKMQPQFRYCNKKMSDEKLLDLNLRELRVLDCQNTVSHTHTH